MSNTMKDIYDAARELQEAQERDRQAEVDKAVKSMRDARILERAWDLMRDAHRVYFGARGGFHPLHLELCEEALRLATSFEDQTDAVFKGAE